MAESLTVTNGSTSTTAISTKTVNELTSDAIRGNYGNTEGEIRAYLKNNNVSATNIDQVISNWLTYRQDQSSSSGSGTSSSSYTVAKSNIKILQQPGDNVRALYATWSRVGGTNQTHVEHYEYQWIWFLKKNQTKAEDAFSGSSGTAEKNSLTSEFTAPDNAAKVCFRVKAIAETHTVKVKKTKTTKDKKGKEKTTTETVEEEQPWFTEKWSSYQEYVIPAEPKTPVHKVDSITLTKVAGNQYKFIAEWTDSFSSDKVSGYEYEWVYYDGLVWQTGTSGTNPQVRKALEYTCPENARKVQIKITPVPVNEKDFVGEMEYKTLKVVEETRSITGLTLFLRNPESRQYEAKWKIDDIENVESFEAHWQYWNGKIDKNLRSWSGDTSTTVNVENRSSKQNAKEKNWTWSSTYNPDAEATAIHVRVKPIAKDNAFTGEWSDWIKLEIDIPTRSVGAVRLTHVDGTSRTMMATWGMTDTTNLASFEYYWRYANESDNPYTNPYFEGGGGTVDARIYKGSPTAESKVWNITFDAPATAKKIQFQVKPVPAYETAFTGDWSEMVTYSFNVPTRKCKNIQVGLYDAANKTLYATWTIADKTNVDHYEYNWQYYAKGLWFEGGGGTTPTSLVNEPTCVYNAPSEAEKVKFNVYPVATVDSYFVGAWAKNVTYIFKVDTRTVDSCSLTLRAETDRTIDATWFMADSDNTTGFETQWQYQPRGTTLWIDAGGGGSVDINSMSSNTFGKGRSWTSSIDAPANAIAIRFRVKPNPESDNVYVGEWKGPFEYKFIVPTIQVTSVYLDFERGGDNAVIATWTGLSNQYIGSYEYEWRYFVFTKNGRKTILDGSSGTSSSDTTSCTYDAPANASHVEFRVRAVPDSERTTAFNGEWSKRFILTIPEDTTPEAPSSPTLDINQYQLTMSLETYDEKASHITFQLVDDNAGLIINPGITYQTGTFGSDIINNKAAAQTTLPAGVTVRARARAEASDGTMSNWSEYSSSVSSPPSSVTGVTVSALSANSVSVKWNRVVTATAYTIEYATKTTYFDAAPNQVQSVTINETAGTGKKEGIITDLAAGSWYFRVKSTNEQGESGWSSIVTVAVGSIPSAPTTWSSTTTAIVGRNVYLYFVHNCEDGSTWQNAQIEINRNGTTSVETLTPASDGSDAETGSYVLSTSSMSAGAKIRWRVRTRGVVPTYGPWSTSRAIDIYAPPTLSVTLSNSNSWRWNSFQFNTDNIYSASGDHTPLPNSQMTEFPLLVYFTAGPNSQTPVSYILTITANSTYETFVEDGESKIVIAGEEVFRKTYSTNLSSFMTMISAGDVQLETGESYTVTATVAMDSGLTATHSMIFTVFWGSEDYTVDAEVGYNDDDVSCFIRPFCDDYDGVAASNITLSVYRREFDGSFTEIATGLSNRIRPTVVDPHPSLDYARYRIVGRSEVTGRILYQDLPGYPINHSSIIIQWNERYTPFEMTSSDYYYSSINGGSMIKLPYNIDVNDENDPDVEFVNYIGRKHPVSYYGTHIGRTASWSAQIPKEDKELIYQLRRLAVYMGDVYIREPSGMGYWAQVKVSFTQTHREVLVPVSLSITQVEGGK